MNCFSINMFLALNKKAQRARSSGLQTACPRSKLCPRQRQQHSQRRGLWLDSEGRRQIQHNPRLPSSTCAMPKHAKVNVQVHRKKTCQGPTHRELAPSCLPRQCAHWCEVAWALIPPRHHQLCARLASSLCASVSKHCSEQKARQPASHCAAQQCRFRCPASECVAN